ncbi:MAG: DUF1343 domain-containing protein [Oligoflexia bacterium]|nr:DUF1343 domain-containing protein [Oligoflexia bacterium]
MNSSNNNINNNIKRVITGLEQLLQGPKYQNILQGRIGLLCNSAAVTHNLELGAVALKRILGNRLKKLFGPQHGFLTTVQDNMIESSDFYHQALDLQIYSLYSNTRIPTEEMLSDLDTILVDLQDIGGRVYTYIYTMTLLMDTVAKLNQSGKSNIKVVILDRPNPIGGDLIEGNILEKEYRSFVGLHPLPARHGLTIGEVAQMIYRYGFDLDELDELDDVDDNKQSKFLANNLQLEIIPMLNWQREMSFDQTSLPFVIPSPNISNLDACYTFPGTVIFEGTNISEGRGTVRALEIIGHPQLEPFSFCSSMTKIFNHLNLTGFVLRPLSFMPTFNKFQQQTCGGLQIHVTDKKLFRPWKVSLMLLKYLFHDKLLKNVFKWKAPPYEYEYTKLPFDIINGSTKIRQWIESTSTDYNYTIDDNYKHVEDIYSQLLELENGNDLKKYLNKRQNILLY